ncbi:SUKH-4 family immunity protein [Dactylosporangium aurantiacum]|uniref:SUKH-4 family immunity protein n=1 Tax=Dactylosporangium aurantiacum TaxID=35754 RepID=A0A9Q9MR18_9ACTN|nr:SUKH-4 family immunity protein [Dactylosporangium aurantiacum]MDG6109895.1 SUKH-4 family immunity protein [Dactylosporangium aurantiacum]UWZ58107.1 SUKH-4 family immunity protein [Dactylosporangium aurantiacum]
MPTPPTFEELTAWAGAGRVVRAPAHAVADWRLPAPQKAALTDPGVPLFAELVHHAAFTATPVMYRLAVYDDRDEGNRVRWDYGAVPGSGEVLEWPADGRPTRFVNSSVRHWLCTLHLVGGWLRGSAAIGRWDEDEEAEERALEEIDDLLRRIGALDPAAIGDGHHDTQFWPAVLGRWLY